MGLPVELVQWLSAIHPLSGVETEALAAHISECHYPKGRILLHAGDVQKDLFLVYQGVQMAVSESGRGTHVMAFTYPPGLCAVPGSFPMQRPSSHSIVCLTDSRLGRLSHGHLTALYDRFPAVERLFRKLTEQVLAGVIDRHLEFHTLPIQERYVRFCNRSPHLLQVVPHRYIASYLGMDHTNFSKLYNTVRF
jgi:CRP-like cAMP-binding protein